MPFGAPHGDPRMNVRCVVMCSDRCARSAVRALPIERRPAGWGNARVAGRWLGGRGGVAVGASDTECRRRWLVEHVLGPDGARLGLGARLCPVIVSRQHSRGVTPRSGLLAVLFTDLAGSTEQRARLGDVAGDALRREHDAIVARALRLHGGELVRDW